ncbi:DUF4399 domain-containing protein [Ruegeria pomeroyi]|uniref:DUF4399 domain-containing protein n=1 Tax=Ruegeria alba TaxID=2916756 RepID=A0ABS9NY53_9RHOB|nr:DUF4399 domain-containing protein [Ruegeria pomeroyi]MCG6559084.1 DUF4399 domain-containing protein [Ruegeria alba]MCE8520863.1 DUF4399 domain-containing protein [Ruegeria pomeroyi]MCE8524616.1 DUF4399 domain-containing protein [Ruegeria pomeroyi]MCE8528841.1 DUF4399 domain-containing protein [Ruegeria pomeroyi]
MKQLAACLAALAIALPAFAGGDTVANPEARVYFANLADGDTVSSPVRVIFGLSGMGVAPAGTKAENTGHHHLLVDRPPMGQGEDGAEELTYALPADEHHRHFGKGQTEVTLDLEPGKHTLQLVMGDYTHVPHSTPIVSEVITIEVK